MNSTQRHYSFIDQILMQVNNCLITLSGNQTAERAYPAELIPEATLSAQEQRQSAGFMRVNHSGEVSAQALYNAQALVARDPAIQQTFFQCSKEETDHLAWCNRRLNELNSHRSYLNIFWYWNSFFIGLTAGIAGDKWSLGFVEETEIQVSKHLQNHLTQLAPHDEKSREIIQQMEIDETQHAETAKAKGAESLPTPVKILMGWHAKVMTTLAYWF